MRRQFVQEWQEMRDALKRYRQEQSERYLQFLLQRKQALDEYFGH
jgi:phage regulator Rha-like protein